VLAVSADTNLCTMIEAEHIHTINPRDSMRWSSRDLAKAIFGDGSRIPNTFACHRQTYRHDRVNHALDAVYGSAQPNYVDDGMDIDEDVFQQPALRPPHLLDDLHFQIIEHFSILLINLVKRVAPHIFHNQERAGSGASIHSPYSKPIQVWNARDCVEYLGNPGLLAFPQSAPLESVRCISVIGSIKHLGEFLAKRYQPGARKGQEWTTSQWYSALRTLEALGAVWGETSIHDSLQELHPQMDLVFHTPMRPT